MGYIGQSEDSAIDNITIDDAESITSNVDSDSYSPQSQVTVDIHTNIDKDSPSDLSDGREDSYIGQHITSEVDGQQHSSSNESYEHSQAQADGLVESKEDSYTVQHSSSDDSYEHSPALADSLEQKVTEPVYK